MNSCNLLNPEILLTGFTRLIEVVDSFAFDRFLGEIPAGFHEFAQLREARVACHPFLITEVDLLHDHGDLQQSVREVEHWIVNASTRPSRVMLQQLSASITACQAR